VAGNVSIDEIVFAYPARPYINVSDRLTLHAYQGETIALVGPSGGGKSTVISLLQRFYNPKSGEIVSTIFHNLLNHLFILDNRSDSDQPLCSSLFASRGRACWTRASAVFRINL
jgi:ABC-type oligopeptide transport system ATPase subunit